MNGELLYDIVNKYLHNYREELESEDHTYASKYLRQAREKLETALNKEQLEIADSYIRYYIVWQEDVYSQLEVKRLMTGIKIGMELQKEVDGDKY